MPVTLRNRNPGRSRSARKAVANADHAEVHGIAPYPAHRSALTDCQKLVRSGLPGRKAIVVFGYDYNDWPMVSCPLEGEAWRASDLRASDWAGL